MTAESVEIRNWLPFASPRVDLSGFWFRPTVIGTWATTAIDAASAGDATLRLGTCGGAILFVNWPRDRLDGGLSAAISKARRVPGRAEGRRERASHLVRRSRRARRPLFLPARLSRRPGAPGRCRFPVDGRSRRAVEAALDQMHFEQPAYGAGEVALVTEAPAAARRPGVGDDRGRLHVVREALPGDTPRRRRTRLPIADARSAAGRFPAFQGRAHRRRLHGVARVRRRNLPCRAAGQGARDACRRASTEALDEVAEHAEADTVRALARLASGRGGAETDRDDPRHAAGDRGLPRLRRLHPRAAALVPASAYGERHRARSSASASTSAILGYRYWMDEPGNDVQWYFSENHALLFHTAAYLAGHSCPTRRFVRSGRTGREQSEVGSERVRAWLDHFEHGKWPSSTRRRISPSTSRA